MSELLKEVSQLDESKQVLVEQEKESSSPCSDKDKECHKRWLETLSDCE